MSPTLSLSRFTFREVIQSRVFIILALSCLLIPLSGIIISGLFLKDIGKVYADVAIAGAHLCSVIFILFIAVSLLSKDIENRVCYLLISPPVSRSHYLLARFFGLCAAFFLLIVIASMSSYVGMLVYVSNLPEAYQSELSYMFPIKIMFYIFFQYIPILAMVFFIFSWASGTAEIMLFSASILLFSWLFPPVLQAMQLEEVADKTPPLLLKLLHYIYDILPHLSGNNLATYIAHHIELESAQVIWYLTEHMTYSAAALLLALFIFRRRDL